MDPARYGNDDCGVGGLWEEEVGCEESSSALAMADGEVGGGGVAEAERTRRRRRAYGS